MSSEPVCSAHDVAAYILSKKSPLTTMKLQKLLYYSQAWSLAWDERPMFREPIEAWANGPVVRDVYELHRGRFEVSDWPHGDAKNLDRKARGTVAAVLRYYGQRPAQWLSDLAHMEDPWQLAREGMPEGERGNQEITWASMSEYYGGLMPNA